MVPTLGTLSTSFKTIYRNMLRQKLEPEVSILPKLIEPHHICFDIGAAYGRYTLSLARLAFQGRVYSFEPGSFSWEVLTTCIRFHRLKNVVKIKTALGNKKGRVWLSVPVKKNNRLGYSLAHVVSRGYEDSADKRLEEVECTTLDDFCTKEQIPRVDFIKCDVEGTEYFVFEGGQFTLRHHRPTVLCEVDGNLMRRFQCEPGQVENFFRKRNYQMFVFRENLQPVNTVQEQGNYFFIPQERTQSLRSPHAT